MRRYWPVYFGKKIQISNSSMEDSEIYPERIIIPYTMYAKLTLLNTNSLYNRAIEHFQKVVFTYLLKLIFFSISVHSFQYTLYSKVYKNVVYC